MIGPGPEPKCPRRRGPGPGMGPRAPGPGPGVRPRAPAPWAPGPGPGPNHLSIHPSIHPSIHLYIYEPMGHVRNHRIYFLIWGWGDKERRICVLMELLFITRNPSGRYTPNKESTLRNISSGIYPYGRISTYIGPYLKTPGPSMGEWGLALRPPVL